MLKKIGLVLLVLVGISVIYVLMFLSVFGNRFTAFYKDCMKIREGMSVPEAEDIMRPYMEDSRYDFGREGALNGEGLYFSTDGGDQCYIVTRNSLVTKILPKFEP